MTKDVTSVNEDAPVPEISALLDVKKVRRVPVLKNGKVVGIISRANILQALAAERERPLKARSMDDRLIRENLMSVLNKEQWAQSAQLNVIVSDGVVDLYGVVRSDEQRRALCVAAENVEGVKKVEDHLGMLQTRPPL